MLPFWSRFQNFKIVFCFPPVSIKPALKTNPVFASFHTLFLLTSCAELGLQRKIQLYQTGVLLLFRDMSNCSSQIFLVSPVLHLITIPIMLPLSAGNYNQLYLKGSNLGKTIFSHCLICLSKGLWGFLCYTCGRKISPKRNQ